ncbi:phage tail domain-containing protein [Paenibacillus xylanexedens]|uniref:phage tail domain-containing protein n=1 Tax=Paenibacillus xylanexedens TaxID=528191 RepID=UPI0021B631EB|nr:phage tail domain-containing protein [Paenibacillus xylanexedens]
MILITIRDSLYFSFAGVKSVDYGILNVNLNSGMQEEVFFSSQEIIEEKVKGRDKPYYMRTETEPLKFSVSFAFEETWNTEKIREVARWLTQHDYYQELYFVNEDGLGSERIFYAKVVDDSTLVHNCLKQGYINLTFRCDSPYSYSPIMTSRVYKWNYTPMEIEKNTYSMGTHQSTTTNSQGNLILKSQRPQWSDFPTGTKWSDI